jgi:hypothetical protein
MSVRADGKVCRDSSTCGEHCGSDEKQLGSNLGPITAENQLKLGSVTQNQAKRINEIALRWLLRDQAVRGSNPLSPTNSNQQLSKSPGVRGLSKGLTFALPARVAPRTRATP